MQRAEPDWKVYVKRANGEVIEAFTWPHGKAAGIGHAMDCALKANHDPVLVWAEPVKETIQ